MIKSEVNLRRNCTNKNNLTTSKPYDILKKAKNETNAVPLNLVQRGRQGETHFYKLWDTNAFFRLGKRHFLKVWYILTQTVH
jgi:hypothetical protein